MGTFSRLKLEVQKYCIAIEVVVENEIGHRVEE
jgi:hypothetical protein